MDHKIGSGARCAMIGYGSWATALAKVLTENEPSIGWYVRNPEVLESLRDKGRNPRYLSNVRFDRTRINPSDDLDRVVSEADIVILASPSAYLKKTLETLTVPLKDKFVISAIKGIVPDDYTTVVEYMHDHYDLSFKQLGIITGPSHAEEVSLERLSYLTVVCTDPENSHTIGHKFATEYIKLSYSTDLYGIEYATILKNIYAVAVGMAVGLGYGDNFLAVLISNSAIPAGKLPRPARNPRLGLPGRPAGDLLFRLQPQPQTGPADRARLHGPRCFGRNDPGGRRLFRRRLHPSHQRPPQGADAHCRYGL